MTLRRIQVQGDTELDDEIDARVTAAEEDSERRGDEIRTSLRLGREQTRAIKRAAALYGMPYQTYLKQAAFRQALADLQAASLAGIS